VLWNSWFLDLYLLNENAGAYMLNNCWMHDAQMKRGRRIGEKSQ